MSTRRSLLRTGVLIAALSALGAASAWAQVPDPAIGNVSFSSIDHDSAVVTFSTNNPTNVPATLEVGFEEVDAPQAGFSLPNLPAKPDRSGSVAWRTGGGSFTVTVTGLKPNQNYLVGIRGLPATGANVQANVQGWQYRTSATATDGTSTAESFMKTLVSPTGPGGSSVNPTMVTATPGTTSITLKWTAATATVSGYQLAWMESTNANATFDANPPLLMRVAATAVEGTITGLKPEKSYRVAIRGLEYGTSTAGEWQHVSGLVTTKAHTLVAPEPVRVVVVGWNPADLNVSWMSVTGATGYTVEWRSSGQDWGLASQSTTVAGGASTKTTISNVDYGTDYDVRVRATNASGAGPWSLHAKVRVDEEIHEAPVVTATAGNLQFTVDWTAVTYATSYCVYVRPTADRAHYGSTDCSHGAETTTRRMVITDYYDPGTGTRKSVKNGTEYTVDVSGWNNASGGPRSKVVTVTPMGAPTEAPAIELMAGDAMLTVSWEVDAAAAEYEIQWRTEGQSFGAAARKAEVEVTDAATTMVGDIAMMSYDITELTNGMTYEVRVRSMNAHGKSPWSQGEAMAGTQPVPALPLFGALVLGAGLMTAGRRRLRARNRRLLKA